MRALLLIINMLTVLACDSSSNAKININSNNDTLIFNDSTLFHKDSAYNIDSTINRVEMKPTDNKAHKNTHISNVKTKENDKTIPHIHPQNPKIKHIKDSLNKIKRRK